jgi:hypothetical protein
MEKTKIDYAITFFFLLLSSKASFIFYYDIYWFIFILLTLIYGFSKKRIFEKDLYVFASFGAIYISYIIFRNVLINNLPVSFIVSDLFFLFKFILVSYCFCIVLKDNATEIFSDVVSKLALISLILFAVQLAGGANILFSIGRFVINKAPFVPYFEEDYSNFFIFTYDKLHFYRNAGFAWEPGAFGCFLVIALFFNLLNNNLKFNRNSYILLIALFTTVSTTAFLALGFFMILLYRAKGGKWNFGILAMLVVFVIAFFYLPFLGDKIKKIYEDDVKVLDDYEAIEWDLVYYEQFDGSYPLNRFSSGIFLYRHFKYQLIFGVSNAYTKIHSKIYDVEISKFNISNGTMDFIAKFGIIGLIFLLFKVGQFAYLFFEKIEYSIYWILAIVALGFGEPIFILPLTLMFIFLPNYTIVDESETLEDSQTLDEKEEIAE